MSSQCFQSPPPSLVVWQGVASPTCALPTLGPLVCCIIVYFAVEDVTFSHLGAHLPGPVLSPTLLPSAL